ncbi:CoF synthetase, partial [Escherichia albertii]|nr:CoF synthetase [Escherichia albertii]
MIPLTLLWRYFRTRRLRFTDRQALENWQAKRLHLFRQNVLSQSPWFQRYLALPFNQWPLMDKALMMTHFDEMNTAGLKRDELLACAMRSEQSRDFKPCIGKFSVGLSSGTSGCRGFFVVSPHEQQIWAAGVLAKVLPDGLFAKERVALFLRADNNLYQRVNNRWLSLDFYDLLAPFQAQLKRLQQQTPTIIVAPAQVLRALALAVIAGELTLKVKKVISVAEVLEPQDRELLRSVFNNVGEIYQATEGFLASTCRCGTLHLNEEFVHIEPQWLDDVLVASEQPCSCGSATMAIARIEGRQDDQLQLLTNSGDMQTIFADACSRVLAMTLPLT